MAWNSHFIDIDTCITCGTTRAFNPLYDKKTKDWLCDKCRGIDIPKVFKYDEVLPIESHLSTVWMINFEAGPRKLQIWHKDAKIEEIVEATKAMYPKDKFDVEAVNVGSIWVHSIENMMSDGRKLNQDMEVVI